MPSSAGKRRREQQKLEKAQAKAQRRVARQSAPQPSEDLGHRSEAALIDELRALHLAFEAGEVSPEDFEERHNRLQAQFEQLS